MKQSALPAPKKPSNTPAFRQPRNAGRPQRRHPITALLSPGPLRRISHIVRSERGLTGLPEMPEFKCLNTLSRFHRKQQLFSIIQASIRPSQIITLADVERTSIRQPKDGSISKTGNRLCIHIVLAPVEPHCS